MTKQHNEVTDKTLLAAVAAIARRINDPVDRMDRQTGEVTTTNRLGFAQRNVMNRLALTLHYLCEDQTAFVDEHREKLREAIRTSDGMEISIRQLERAQGTIETAEMALAEMTAIKNAMITIASQVSGKPWQAPAPRAKTKAADVDDRLAKLAAFAGLTAEDTNPTRTNGTQGDETEGATAQTHTKVA